MPMGGGVLILACFGCFGVICYIHRDGYQGCFVQSESVPVAPISRGPVSRLFALIKDEPSELAGAGGDATGGGAIYAAALPQQPSDMSRSPRPGRTCERPGPASPSGRRRRVDLLTRAGAEAPSDY